MPPARPSLLWPGARPAALHRADWWACAAAYLLSVVVRWPIRLSHPYTAEASHFVVSLDLWTNAANISPLDPNLPPDDFSWFFWQRPLLALLLSPSAHLGWEAYRTTHLLLGAFVPVLAALLLRRLAVRPAYAYTSAAILAVHPVLVPWNVLALPDTLLCLFTLGALLTAHQGRPLPTAGLLLAGAWVKEVGFVTALALGLLAWWRDADGQRGRLWPLEMGRFATALLPIVPLAFLPLYVSMQIPGAAFPGFRVGGELAPMLERLTLVLWLAPLPFLGLLDARTRRLAAVAAAWPAFFLVYHLATHKAIESWYNVVPATLVLLAAAATLSHLQDRLPAPRRWAPVAAAGLLATALLVQVALPQAEPLNRAVATPLSGTGQWSLEEALAYEGQREDDLYAVMARVPTDERTAWIAIDLDWSLVMYPVAHEADHVYKEYTGAGLTDEQVRAWAHDIERRADATLLFRNDRPFNLAVRDAYATCLTEVGNYALVLPDPCRGSDNALVSAYHARQRAA